MHVLEHQDDRAAPALGAEPVLVGTAHLIAAQHGILPRGAQLQALFLGERSAHNLAQELGHAAAIGLGHHARHAGGELLPADGKRFAVGDPGGARDGLGDHRERRPRTHRIAAADEHLDVLRAAAHAPQELAAQARLAQSRGPGKEHRARHLVAGALVEGGLERAQIAVTSHTGRGSPEHRTRDVARLARAAELGPLALLDDLEAQVEQASGDVVEHHGAARGALRAGRRGRISQQLRGAVEDLANRKAPRHDTPPRGQHDVGLGHHLAQRQGEPRGVRRVIGGIPLAHERGHERAVGETFDLRAEPPEG